MTQNRSSSRLNRRRITGFLTGAAAVAIAFSVAPDGYRHINTGAPRLAMALGGGSGGAQGGGFGHHHVRPGVVVVSQNGTEGPRQAGVGDDQLDGGGFAPEGEDGLTTLADFIRGQDDGSNPIPGEQHGWDGYPSTPPGSGFGAGGGYTGGGSGGGGGGSGGSGGSGGNGGGPIGGDNGGGDNGGGNNGGGGPGAGGTDGDPGSHFPGDGGGNNCFGYCQPGGGGDWPNTDDPTGGDSPVTSAVPEPATWMMLILGFGVLGSVLRVQRRKGGRVLA